MVMLSSQVDSEDLLRDSDAIYLETLKCRIAPLSFFFF